MTDNFSLAELVVRAEYQRLCNYLGLVPVPLDVYVCNAEDSSGSTTSLGTLIANCDPLYSGTKRLMVLPFTDASDQWPVALPAFPPPSWLKHEWPVWRIELWHEVVHQVSNDLLAGWNPTETPRQRPNGTRSQTGHGLGWFKGVQHFASKLGVDAEGLDALLDQ